MLRNRYLSSIRRAARGPIDELSSAEYDSADIRLRSSDPREQLKVLDELREICGYACTRKQTSRAGSILILRFFLGYYPSEIAQVTRSSRQAVDSWLKIARTEARMYLDDPMRLRFLGQGEKHTAIQRASGAPDDFLVELRRAIFNSCDGKCPSSPGLQEIYTAPAGVGSEVLAHIVSCSACLDAVNSLLGLPPLRDRYPVDTVGRDKGPPDGPRTGGTVKESTLIQSRRKSRDVFEHSPTKLSISVNGFIVGTQSISSETSEVTLNVNVDEKIGFVEVHSEQGVLMLGLDVEPPPDGPPEQSARVELSEGRRLDVAMSFAAAWPAVTVSYRDPSLKSVTVTATAAAAVQESYSGHAQPADGIPPRTAKGDAGDKRGTSSRWKELVRRLGELAASGFWYRPGTITAALAIILIAVLLLVRMPITPVSAAVLLDKASESERLLLAKTDTAVHRTLRLETRNSSRNAVVSHNKIETWRSSAAIDGQTSVRRYYDELGKLVAGEFVDQQGSRKTYSSPGAAADNFVEVTGQRIWTIEPSAGGFRSMMGADQRSATVTEDPRAFRICFDNKRRGGPQELINGSLLLAKPDLHATEEIIQVGRGGDWLEFKFIEEAYEEVKPAVLPRGIFKVDPVLVPVEGSATRPLPDSGGVPGPGSTPRSNESIKASADLEVEVEFLLDGVKANLGEQVSLSRTPDDKLLVKGIVETESRKARILEALGSVAHNPAVNIDISAVAEMARRQKSSSTTATVQQVEIEAEGRIPLYQELRQHLLSGGVSEEKVEEEVRRFSAHVLKESAEALRNAWALGRLAEQMSRTADQHLGSEARSKQLVMIRQHASSCKSAYESLRKELDAVLPAVAGSGGAQEPPAINDETDLARMLRLFVAQAAAADAAVRSAFTISSGTSDFSQGTRARLRESLARAEAIAAKIAQFARDRGVAGSMSPGE